MFLSSLFGALTLVSVASAALEVDFEDPGKYRFRVIT
jgi:hypothetical protein